MTAAALPLPAYHATVPNGRPWTPDEDAIIRARYVSHGAQAVAGELGRSLSSVCHRADRIGIQSHRRWTPADDARLRFLWGQHPLTTLAAKIGRTVATTYWRAQKLKLTGAPAQGFEYLTDAARRAGYTTSQLRRILEWDGTGKLHCVMARPTRSKSGRRFHVLDPFDVDEAVARWLATEPIESAARRHGITGETLKRVLLRSGLDLPPAPPRKFHWRIPTETIDRAMASAVIGRWALRDAARKAGVA